MVVAAVLKTLASELSIDEAAAGRALELLSAGYRIPYLARFRREELGGLNEATLRRLDRRRKALEELERRRASLLRTLGEDDGPREPAAEAAPAGPGPASDAAANEGAASPGPSDNGDEATPAPAAPAKPSGTAAAARRKLAPAPEGGRDLSGIEAARDRHELEDQFLTHRRSEPEVQLALDRGLGFLADKLVEPSDDAVEAEPLVTSEEGADDEELPTAETSEAASMPETSTTEDVPAAAEEAAAESDTPPADEVVAENTPEPAAEASETQPDVATSEEASSAGDSAPTGSRPADSEPTDSEPGEPESTGDASASPAEGGEGASADAPKKRKRGKGKGKSPAAERVAAGHASLIHRIDLSPELARACQPFVTPDRDVHTEIQALEGALRILSDRLARDPAVRRMVRRAMRKHGRLDVRALVDASKLGRAKGLIKSNDSIKQLQGHKLLALRQALAQRLISVHVTVDPKHVAPSVRATLGKRLNPAFASVFDAVVDHALTDRIVPMIEEDLRADLRERAEEEGVRFLERHLRQVLLAPAAGRRRAVGVDVNAKGDWTLALVEVDGSPVGEVRRIETAGKPLAELAKALGEALRDSDARTLAVGNGKGSKEAVHKLRECVHLLKADAHVLIVNEAGLSAYANSELGRTELADHAVPARMAISLARRHQDPMGELLKVDPKHLGLGKEQGTVSKASLRRVVQDTIESCCAHVGCELNEAPVSFLRHLPGLDFDTATKIVKRREERPFTSREELKDEGILDELRWTNVIAFLRIRDGVEPLDRTALHPEMYELASQVVQACGGSPAEVLGRRDATKALKRTDYEVDAATWRDLTREIGHPGRDPRLRVFPPELLAPDTPAASLEKERVVEGIVTSVTSFGAFVDIGIPQDGMVHVSEVSDRYVRDARGLLSVGQVVRARVVNPAGQRIELSMKKVPDRRRERPAPRRKGRGERTEAWPEFQPVQRAARSRRDGLVTGGREERGGRGRGGGGGGGGGRGGGPGRGPGRRGGGGRGPGRRQDRDDGYDAAAVKKAVHDTGRYNPFATFFKDRSDSGPDKDPETAPEGGASE